MDISKSYFFYLDDRAIKISDNNSCVAISYCSCINDTTYCSFDQNLGGGAILVTKSLSLVLYKCFYNKCFAPTPGGHTIRFSFDGKKTIFESCFYLNGNDGYNTLTLDYNSAIFQENNITNCIASHVSMHTYQIDQYISYCNFIKNNAIIGPAFDFMNSTCRMTNCNTIDNVVPSGFGAIEVDDNSHIYIMSCYFRRIVADCLFKVNEGKIYVFQIDTDTNDNCGFDVTLNSKPSFNDREIIFPIRTYAKSCDCINKMKYSNIFVSILEIN